MYYEKPLFMKLYRFSEWRFLCAAGDPWFLLAHKLFYNFLLSKSRFWDTIMFEKNMTRGGAF